MANAGKKTAQEMREDIFAFREWLSGGDNGEEHAFLRKALAVAIREELTEKQRLCIAKYYGERMTMPETAVELGLHKSTVSINIARAKQRLIRVLRYTSPRLLNASLSGNIRGSTKRNRREAERL